MGEFFFVRKNIPQFPLYDAKLMTEGNPLGPLGEEGWSGCVNGADSG
jgi:hypothetical protein